ncbi:MAG: hypothetical protein FJ405_16930 [Verrucomicrobia bacterium]|nr:hypothetical protein [Verrucomicrobiota bacterium]
MNPPVPFLAASAGEALRAIEEKLGPDALVVGMRKVPAKGLSRLWRKPLIEVLASPPPRLAKPEPQTPDRRGTQARPLAKDEGDLPTAWDSEGLLTTGGLLPENQAKVIEELEGLYGLTPPGDPAAERAAIANALRRQWTVGSPQDLRRTQILIGPPGSGKTTLLCKLLAKSILAGTGKAEVWRLDGSAPNVAGLLDLHAASLGVTVHRHWGIGKEPSLEGARWVDLPGLEGRDPSAIGELRRVLDKISGAELILVLNGAYEASLLMAQVEAWSRFPLAGLAVTHLDEESRWSKMWNLALGTQIPLRYLGISRSVSGGLLEATPELLTRRLLSRE